jgi:predicted dehydrogenase
LDNPIEGGWPIEIDHWIDVVRGKAPLTMGIDAGRSALEVALAAYQSSETGARIELV